MRSLRAFVSISVVAASLAAASAIAQDYTSCAADPYAGALTATGDGFIGRGGPGAGGDASGIRPLPSPAALCATGLTGAASHAVADWFGALAPADRQKFMREAAKVGVTRPDGRAFGAGQFDEMARVFAEAMTRQGMGDADKLKLLNMMAEDAGIADAGQMATDGKPGR